MLEATDDLATLLEQPEIPASSQKRDALYQRFKALIIPNPALDRALVSFQANKEVPFYSWFKYREGFSEALVTTLLQQLVSLPGVLLDPFSGAGSALFAAQSLGWQARGIEVLPVGVYATRARDLAQHVNPQALRTAVDHLLSVDFASYADDTFAFKHIAITKGAFPLEEEQQLNGYRAYCSRFVEDETLRELLLFAAFCVLESISFTRKDGQYLRWDARSGRSQGKTPFNKGRIYTFREAITEKLKQMVLDLEGRPIQSRLFLDNASPSLPEQPLELSEGSCLEVLPTLEAGSIDAIFTSPPYCNRYDYTRTYALELAYLGCDAEHVKQLRQTLLSCTVENRDKHRLLAQLYAALGQEEWFQHIEASFQQQEALHEVLALLETYRERGELNNENVPRMVRYYFYEMSFVIAELARLLRPGGTIIMVNDNVRYAGEEIPVDLILSSLAESFGLTVQHIWTLGRGKGNSSQQMGNHGRSELRKCVYIWSK